MFAHRADEFQTCPSSEVVVAVPDDPSDGDIVVVLLRGDTEIARWPLTPGEPPDLATVDQLARLQLAAKRSGLSISLDHAGPGLSGLLRLVGLATVLGLAGDREDLADLADLRAEELGQPEHREQLGAEEAVVTDDPVA